MYAKGNILTSETIPSLSALGRILSKELSGNEMVGSGYLVTDRYDTSSIGKIYQGNGIAYKVNNVQTVWVPDGDDGIQKGGKYDLSIDPVNSILAHPMSDLIPVSFDKVPGLWLEEHPSHYTGATVPLLSKMPITEEPIAYQNQLMIALLGQTTSGTTRTVLSSSDLLSLSACTPQAVFRRLSSVVSGETPYQNFEIRIGVSSDLVESLFNSPNAFTPITTFESRERYETGHVIITVGTDTVEIPFRMDGNGGEETCVAIPFVYKDDAGFARQVVFNNKTYNVPVIDITPSSYSYGDEKFKINNLSDLSAGDMLNILVKTIDGVVAGAATVDPALGAVATAMQQIPLMPPEYQSSIAYAMFKIDGMESLGNSVLNMKEKELGNSDLFPYLKGQAYVAYERGYAPEEVNVMTTNYKTLYDVYDLSYLASMGADSGYFSAHLAFAPLGYDVLKNFPSDWVSAFQDWLSNIYAQFG